MSKGNYATIQNKILFDNNLTSSSIQLLILLLNNDENWNINLEFYKKKLKWCSDKMTKVIENLMANGYVNRIQKSKGRGKGFGYYYTISEYGNLNKKEVTEPIITPVNTIREADNKIQELQEPVSTTKSNITPDDATFLLILNSMYDKETESQKQVITNNSLKIFNSLKNKCFPSMDELINYVNDVYVRARRDMSKLKYRQYNMSGVKV